TRSSPRSSRSLVEHQRSPVSGCMASPTQFRNPLANTRRFLPAGSNTRTAARSVSLPHALPRPCSDSQRAIAAASRLPIPSPSFDADPTETNIVRPSLDKTMSALMCPRCPERPPAGGRSRTITSAFPARLEVAAAIGIANHRSRVGDIYPLRIRSGRIERYAERLVEARGEHVVAAGLGRSVGGAQDSNPPWL